MSAKVSIVTDAALTISEDGKKVLLEPKTGSCRATCTNPNWSLLKDPNEPLAMDTEFQEFRLKDAPKWGHRMGRIAVVNTRGQTVYDVYVRYEYDIDTKTKMPPPVFGVTRKDLMLRNGAKGRKEVEDNLRKIFHGRVIVGHGMRLDKTAVGTVWTKEHIENGGIYDTQNYYGQVALCTLASRHLSGKFNFHDPTQDARATMLLYLRLNPYRSRKAFADEFEFDEKEFPALGS